MSAPGITPAPWQRCKGLFGSIVVGPAVLEHPGHDSLFLEKKLAQREADAALIGAAPAMLAALKKAEYSLAWHIEQQGRGVAMDAEHLRLIRAAIAEAEGRA
jgi:hypothetical protein